jgi:hypothetical protein
MEQGTLMTWLVQGILSAHCSINQDDTAERGSLSNKPDRWLPSGISGSLLYFAEEYPIFGSMTETD